MRNNMVLGKSRNSMAWHDIVVSHYYVSLNVELGKDDTKDYLRVADTVVDE